MAIVNGSVVRLKSGGPPMTVVEVTKERNDRDYARCVFFINNDFNEVGFYTDNLDEVRKSEGVDFAELAEKLS